eukprot:Amastigsp_a859599_12.p1 type:complete len:140 gc:universal Amastigsp_a859599_12:81-500(+)
MDEPSDELDSVAFLLANKDQFAAIMHSGDVTTALQLCGQFETRCAAVCENPAMRSLLERELGAHIVELMAHARRTYLGKMLASESENELFVRLLEIYEKTFDVASFDEDALAILAMQRARLEASSLTRELAAARPPGAP